MSKILGNITVKDVVNDRFDLANILLNYIKNNFSDEIYKYILAHPLICLMYGKGTDLQRFIFTRFIIRHLLICKSKYDLPNLAEVFLDIDTKGTMTEWLDKMQTIVLVYCNENRVFETFID